MRVFQALLDDFHPMKQSFSASITKLRGCKRTSFFGFSVM